MITKEQSYIVKGIAILLMLIHHFFTFPEWIIEGGTEYLWFAERFNSPTKLCVCIFAFLNGWAFSLGPATYKDAFRKIKKIYINYWSIMVLAAIFAVVCCGFEITTDVSIKLILGINTSLMIFAWYVPFYCLSLLVITGIERIIKRGVFHAVICGIVLPILLFALLREIPSDADVCTLLNNLKHWYPCITVGYMSNKYGMFYAFKRYLEKYRKPTVILIILMVLCFVGRYYISALDFVYCFFLVYGIVNLHIPSDSLAAQFLIACGKDSTNMWFLHCLYFGVATRAVIQPVAYFIKEPLAIFAVAVIELLICSRLIESIRVSVKRIWLQ